MQINDRVFIVTGASSGIGLSTAIALTDRGAKVALLARSTDALQKLAQQLPGSLPVTADMTQFDGVREAVRAVHRHFGRIDGLINNAGRSYAAAVEEIDPALFDEIFHLNVLGPIVAMQAVIPLMRAQGGGSIVNINSGTAFMAIPQYSVYSASKRALLGFSLTARAELEKDRIVVSEIYPYITATNFGKAGWAIRPAADRPPITPMATSPNSSPAWSCRPSKKARRNISPTIGCARWRAWPAKRSRGATARSDETNVRYAIAYIDNQYAIAYITPMSSIVRTPQQLAATLRRYRRQKSLTQGALGHLMHVRQATVSKLESGERGTQLGVLIDALTALNLELVVRPRTQALTEDIEELF